MFECTQIWRFPYEVHPRPSKLQTEAVSVAFRKEPRGGVV